MNKYGITYTQLESLKLAQEQVKEIEREINETASKHFSITKGDIVEDALTGFHYQVEWFSVSFNRLWDASISLYAYRIWRTGRKAGRRAHNGSFLSITNVKKVETNEKE